MVKLNRTVMKMCRCADCLYYRQSNLCSKSRCYFCEDKQPPEGSHAIDYDLLARVFQDQKKEAYP